MPSVNNPNPPNTYIALTKCWSKNFKLRRKSITLNSGIFVLAAQVSAEINRDFRVVHGNDFEVPTRSSKHWQQRAE